MFSLNSFKTFFKVNFSLISYSFFEFYLDKNNDYFSSFILHLLRNYLFIDVVNFLQYAAEPETESRKKMGVRTMIFLLILFVILILAKKAVWSRVK